MTPVSFRVGKVTKEFAMVTSTLAPQQKRIVPIAKAIAKILVTRAARVLHMSKFSPCTTHSYCFLLVVFTQIVTHSM